MSAHTSDGGSRPAWRGINHLALITNDLEATTRWWHHVLGADLVATVAGPTFRHYFFAVGPTTGVAFFEYRDPDTGERLAVDTLHKDSGVYHRQAGHFDHVSLDLPDEESVMALRDRLRAHGVDVTDVVDHGFIKSVYFDDPNGISLEASCWVGKPDTAVYGDTAQFGDPDPLPAVVEIQAAALTPTAAG